MAKNWTMAEAIKAIAEQNMEDVKDIYRRFPTFAMMATRAVGGDNEAACNIIASLPEWATVNKFEKAIKSDPAPTEEVADDEQEESEEVVDQEEEIDYTSKTGKELVSIIRGAKKMKDLIAKGYTKKKSDILAYIEKYGLDDSTPETEEVEEVDEYADKSAMDLFKECKKAGIKAVPKKDKSYYVDLLKEANEDSEAESNADDDWDEIEPEVEEKPKKAKAEKKPAKKAKPAPKVEEDEDDDEDWDI